MADNNAKNVAAGKPKVGGAVFVAPLGTALPTDAVVKLNEAFANLGYIGDDGVEVETSVDMDTKYAWGGDPVLNLQKQKTDTAKFTLIEALNLDVLKTIYGKSNVTGASIEAGVTVDVTTKPLDSYCWVIDTVLNGIPKRFVYPNANISDMGGVTYKDDEEVGYEITISSVATDGSLHKEYIKKATE